MTSVSGVNCARSLFGFHLRPLVLVDLAGELAFDCFALIELAQATKDGPCEPSG
jgi:hypothetical protein